MSADKYPSICSGQMEALLIKRDNLLDFMAVNNHTKKIPRRKSRFSGCQSFPPPKVTQKNTWTFFSCLQTQHGLDIINQLIWTK